MPRETKFSTVLLPKHSTKLTYVIVHGIAPYYRSQLMKELDDKLFSYHFDENTTTQVKKQYDGYATFYSEAQKKVITSYCGSRFVGRCPATKLKEHFFEFMKKMNLHPRNLLNIGMGGPALIQSSMPSCQLMLLKKMKHRSRHRSRHRRTEAQQHLNPIRL